MTVFHPKTRDLESNGGIIYLVHDNVIIAVRESLTERNESACLKLLFDLMDKAREGGRVIIPESTFRYISYGREGAEELMRVKGLRVQPPRQGEDDRVIGINE